MTTIALAERKAFVCSVKGRPEKIFFRILYGNIETVQSKTIPNVQFSE